ncbi:TnsD family Tn7-like transposition protein [Amphibacillus jilinensis]|uniref:TnsD family Tn7-like transposition protein n=1 Tax=Amphibacillus jilinensis TaxID=1216008 RepID=UPI0002FF8CAE|nr:TnsD family Tn7-like transposition protein [Amphibacillus jilinensis]
MPVINKAVHQLLQEKKTIHINVSRIGKKIRRLALLERHLNKLPKTSDYLNEVVETKEQFQIHRVWCEKITFPDYKNP